jgi:hypothetical protein
MTNGPFLGQPCLLLVCLVVCDSQWELAVNSVIWAIQWELTAASHFIPLSYITRNFGKPISLLATFHAGLLLGLFFNLEDGGDMFFRNISSFPKDFMAL